MIDPVQAVLLFVIILLAVLFVILGIQVYFILSEFRTTLKKTNQILDEVEELTEAVSEPITFISGVLFSSKALGIISKLFKKKKENEPQE